jgi:hypothetical protein
VIDWTMVQSVQVVVVETRWLTKDCLQQVLVLDGRSPKQLGEVQ